MLSLLQALATRHHAPDDPDHVALRLSPHASRRLWQLVEIGRRYSLGSWREKRIGQHVLKLEGDLLSLDLGEQIKIGEMKALAKEHDEALLSLGRLHVLVDLRKVREASRNSNAELKERPKTLPPHFIAYVGAPFSVRVILDLVIRATRLLTGAKVEHRFFDTLEEGRTWLIEMGADPRRGGESSDMT